MTGCSDEDWERSEDYKNGWPRGFKGKGPGARRHALHADRIRTAPATASGQHRAPPVPPTPQTVPRDNTEHRADANKAFGEALKQRAKELVAPATPMYRDNTQHRADANKAFKRFCKQRHRENVARRREARKAEAEAEAEAEARLGLSDE